MQQIASETYHLDQLNDYACQCGGFKEQGTPFCCECIHVLPVHMAADLGQPIGGGFEQAFDAASIWLFHTEEIPHADYQQ